MSELSEQDHKENTELSEPGEDVKEKKDQVEYDTFKRLLSQKKASDEKLAGYEKRLKDIEMKEELDKQENLKKQAKFEELSKELESKLETERSEKETFKKSWLDTHKLQAVLDKLPGKPKRQEYMSFIDLDAIKIDAESGIDADSVEAAANNFLTNYGELLTKPSNSELPNDAPSSKGKLSYEKWLTLSPSDKRSRLKDVIE